MARYKAVNEFEAKSKKQAQLAKKKARNYYIVNGIWGLLLVAGIVIGGIYQENETIVGIVMIAIGVLSFMEVGFIAYAEKHGWSVYEIHPYDYDSTLMKIPSKERREEDRQNYRVTIMIVICILLGCAIWWIIAGVMRII